jgi:3-methyladenine DNA glycosylase AlkD
MDAGAALGALEKAGTEQNRKVLRKHGYPEPLYGVSFAILRTMAKQIGADQAVAEELWASGNTDARLLAAMIADPDALTRDVADRWIAEARCPTLVDEVAKVVARSPLALPCMSSWVAADDEWVGRGGWAVMCVLALEHPEVPDASFTPYVAVIERKIAAAKNRTREKMNGALIAIGGRSDSLATTATAAAKRIGKVEVDHGDTACETPDAVSYIEKMRARATPAKKARPAPKAKAKAKAKQPAKRSPPPKKATKSKRNHKR